MSPRLLILRATSLLLPTTSSEIIKSIERPSFAPVGSFSISLSPSITINDASEELVQINPSSVSSNLAVELINSREDLLGILLVPPLLTSQPNTTLAAFDVDRGNSSNGQALVSSILEITLVDNEGTFVTQLDSPLTICLALANETKKTERICLSYYDEQRGKWRCEDNCLVTNRTREDNLLCGQTDHLTNFALLLSAKGSQADPCQSNQADTTLSWLSFGLILGSILLVSLCGLVIELQIRYRRYKRQKFIGALIEPSLSLPFSFWVQPALRYSRRGIIERFFVSIPVFPVIRCSLL